MTTPHKGTTMKLNLPSQKNFIREFAPSLSQFPSKDFFPELFTMAQKITRKQQLEEIMRALEQRPKLREQFQEQLIYLELQLCKKNIQLLEDQSSHNKKIKFYTLNKESILIIAATTGLMGCLCVILFFRSHMPGEIVGMISAMISIFGTCLKDLYRSEWGNKKDKLPSEKKDI